MPSAANDGDEREQHAADPGEAPERRAAGALLLVAAAPLEDRLGEDVVEQLVARGLASSGGGIGRRMRPLSPRQSLSSTAVTSASGRPVHSARSEAGWAIFVFEA